MPVGIEEVTAPHRTLPDGSHREVDHTLLHRVLPGSIATTETEVLETVLAYGTAKTAALGQFAAGKTGTTSNYGDAWFVGWDSRYTVAVWVGYPNSLVPMTTDFEGGPVLGGTFPALIWHNFMVAAMGVEKRRAEEEAAQRAAAKAAHDGTTTTTSGEAASAVPTTSAPAPAQVPTTPAPSPRSKATPAAPPREATEKQTAPGAKEAPSSPAGQTPPAATPEPSTPTPATPPGSAPAATPEASEPKVSGGTGAPTGGAAPPG
jgi:penicillin-binding protein 1A